MSATDSPLAGLLNNYGDSTLTGLDLLKIGEAVLNLLAAVEVLGHTNPAHTLDYTNTTADLWTGVPRDLVAWASGRKDQAPGCEERLRGLVRDRGWTRHALEQVSEVLSAELGDGKDYGKRAA